LSTKENFVTVLDYRFLPQLLTLYKSMNLHVRHYVLWVVCVDSKLVNALKTLGYDNIRILDLRMFETAELKKVRLERRAGEYCWTLTPFAPDFVFQIESTLSRVTYIDADMWFRKPPTVIFEEFEASGKSVLITDHGYTPEGDRSSVSGQFCVQFIVFNRNGSELVRRDWEAKCIDWCFARVESGKFGDQKYLDEWPIKFPDIVHIVRDKELFFAPWSSLRFPYGNSVCCHFHGLRLTNRKTLYIGDYAIPKVVWECVYKPYIGEICEVIDGLGLLSMDVLPQRESGGFLRRALHLTKRLLFALSNRSILPGGMEISMRKKIFSRGV